jgi:hypothetical protein
LAVLVLALLVVAGVVLAARDHGAQTYRMSGSHKVTLADGRDGPATTLSVGQAIALQPRRPRLVRGYLLRPMDDDARLCARLNEYADCRGAPRLILVNLGSESLFGPHPIQGLMHGCCATGFWTPHQIALRGVVVGRKLYLVPSLP